MSQSKNPYKKGIPARQAIEEGIDELHAQKEDWERCCFEDFFAGLEDDSFDFVSDLI